MVLVDTINVHQTLIDHDDLDEYPYDWFTDLDMKMIDKTYDSTSSPRRNWTQEEAAITPQSASILVLGYMKGKNDGHFVYQ